MRNKPSKIILHSSDTPPSMDIGVAEIRQWHLERGFRDIGYHYVIRRNGIVELGRHEDIKGAHCKDGGGNNDSLGICLVGRDKWTYNQIESLCKLYGNIRIRHEIPTKHVCKLRILTILPLY
jgi:N-acetyl-anhydromuramyl-L-alanine amidase AmpD